MLPCSPGESLAGRNDRELGRAIGRMLHLDDPDRLDLLARAIAA
ncbi:hypothetical protein [Micromonospora lutea]|nr:hypothetical protein [Micromonospora lutea]